MPRNGSSVYSLPAGNPVIPGTIIATTWANTTLTDIATALTNSLSTDGSTASVSLAGKTLAGGTFSAPTVTGLLTLTGGQIAFPAVQIPSAGVNVLDDYEEGTWTPTMTFVVPGNINTIYAGRAGSYTKVGNSVAIQFGVNISTFTHTTSSGGLIVSGLPFTPAARFTLAPSFLSGFNAGAAANAQLVCFADLPNGTDVQIYAINLSGGTSLQVTAANHSSGTGVLLNASGTYLV